MWATPLRHSSRPATATKLNGERCATYLSTEGSDGPVGSRDLDLSRCLPEFLGVFAPSSNPFWLPTSVEEATPPIASASDRVIAAGSAEDAGSVGS